MKENKSQSFDKPRTGLKPRPPVVVILGHVDHGKTTLLDYIRKTNVAAKEPGAITQSIGAYEIEHNDKKITFIDTPGHEAFSKMRERGTKVADLAILIVAADEGVKPQTKESVEILTKVKTPFIIALNKIDKPGANIEKTKNELMSLGVLLEGHGGDISYQQISAKTGKGVDELLDLILLAAELENLEYNPQGETKGIIIEAKINSQRGILVSVIVKDGIIKKNQTVLTLTASGKIKSLENFLGKRVDSLEPSSPALILGFNSLPKVGEEFSAGEVKIGIIEIKAEPPRFQETIRGKTSEQEEVNLILKADNSGSLEALVKSVKDLFSPKIPFQILGQGVGEINENDLKLALTTKALVVGFGVDLDKAAENLRKIKKVDVITSEIVYKLVEELENYLKQFKKAEPSSELEILATFSQSGKQQVIGGKVLTGSVKINSEFEIERKKKNIGKGRILNLKEKKKDVKEAGTGKETGLLIESDIIIEAGDKLVFSI